MIQLFYYFFHSEVEIDRLFRTNAFNIAKRKFKDSNIEFDVPDDEHWILYGPKIPEKRKILKNSPLVYEVLYTEGDYRLLSLGNEQHDINSNRKVSRARNKRMSSEKRS